MRYQIRVQNIRALLILSAQSLAWAQGDCALCSTEPRFPEAATVLAANGFPPSRYTVLLTWSEAVPNARGRFVTGYRIAPLAGGRPFDVYTDSEDRRIPEEVLKQLGIRHKNWDIRPVEQLAEIPTAVSEWIAPRPDAIGPAKSITPTEVVVLDPVDLAQITAEDAAREREQGKGAMRIGVFQSLPEVVEVTGAFATHGDWESLPGGGGLWSVMIHSPDALGVRVHFAAIELPAAAQVIVYNANVPTEAYGPYRSPSPHTSDLWSATCFSDTVVIECYVADAADIDRVHLTIDRIVHNYVELGSLPWAKGAGSCNLDVTCYTSWAATSYGVGGVGSVGGNGSFFCTGSLLADTDGATMIPYFLTANHCIGSQSAADSTEIYWLYQTPYCNGPPPNPATVPRTTGGADLLATTTANAGTDFCLLRLRGTVPSGVSYLGWTSSEAVIGTPTVCIHHPSADYKRITFGDITNVPESSLGIRPRERYHQSSWRPNLGVTEPGSSGSPLFMESTQQVIGQLWGGPSSCSPSSTKLDYYGRFDVSFPLIEQWLDPENTAAITVTRPAAGARWRQGATKRIRWTYEGDVGDRVQIDLYRGGVFYETLKANTKNDGKARWIIPLDQPVGNDYVIVVTSKSNPAIFDLSDTFGIRAP